MKYLNKIMNKKIIILLLLFIFGFVNFSYSQSQGDIENKLSILLERAKKSYFNGNYHEALSLFTQVYNIGEQIEDIKLIQLTLLAIGEIYIKLDQYDKARLILKKKLELSIMVGDKKSIFQVLAYGNDKLELHKTILEIINENNSASVNAKINLLVYIEGIYLTINRYMRALEIAHKALDLIKNNDIKNINLYWEVYNDIGYIYLELDQFEKSYFYCNKSLELSKKLAIPIQLAESLRLMGLYYHKLGFYDLAFEYYQDSLNIVENEKTDESILKFKDRLYYELGMLYANLKNYDTALDYLQQSLNYFKQSSNFEKKTYINLLIKRLINIGAVLFKQKQYEQAEKIFLKADKLIEDNNSKFGNSGLVALYIATERYQQALDYLDKMKPKWDAHSGYIFQYYTQRGIALKGQNQLKEASNELLKAVLTSENTRQHAANKLNYFSTGGLYNDGRILPYKVLVSTLCNRHINGEKQDDSFISYGENIASCAYFFSELTKARFLLEEMSKSRKKYCQYSIPDDLREQEQHILNQLYETNKQFEIAHGLRKDDFIKLEQKKQRQTKNLDSFIADLCKKYPKYAAIHYPAKFLSKQKIPLKSTEVLFEYLIEQNAAYLFIVRKEGVQHIIKIQINKEDLEKMIYDYLPSTPEPVKGSKFWIALKKKVNKFFSKTFSLSLGNKLYEILLSKAMAYVKPDDNIIIIPDEILGLIPFESLIIKAGKNFKDSIYVGDKYNIVYYQSAAILALNRLAKSSAAKKTFLAIGNPIFSENDPRYTSYKKKILKGFVNDNSSSYETSLTVRALRRYGIYMPLPETRNEVEYLAEIFKIQKSPPDILLDMNASELNFKKSITNSNYRYIHFATHADLAGKIQGINESFIVLNQVENNKEEDGIITLSEVTNLKLNSDLVVLSACQTGVGNIVSGEGILSFARAFHQAGSKGVVVSLWPVVSESAVDYMKTFYSYIKNNKNKAEAMKLTRKHIKSKHPTPLYWAAFILHGE